MKPIRQDKVHCMKHACTYSADQRCPYCELEQLKRAAKDDKPITAQPKGRKSGASGCFRAYEPGES